MTGIIPAILGGLAHTAVFIGAPMGVGYLSAQPIPDCYYEPVRTVRYIGPDAPNYQFEVAGCEFRANADKYVVVE